MEMYMLVSANPYTQLPFSDSMWEPNEMSCGLVAEAASKHLIPRMRPNLEGRVGLYDLETDTTITKFSEIFSNKKRHHIVWVRANNVGQKVSIADVGLNLENSIARFVVDMGEGFWLVPKNDFVYERKHLGDVPRTEVIRDYLYTPFIWDDTAKSWEAYFNRVKNTRKKFAKRLKLLQDHLIKTLSLRNHPAYKTPYLSDEHEGYDELGNVHGFNVKSRMRIDHMALRRPHFLVSDQSCDLENQLWVHNVIDIISLYDVTDAIDFPPGNPRLRFRVR